MTTLRQRVIRLASTSPELRPHLLPLLKRASTDLKELLEERYDVLYLGSIMFGEIKRIHEWFTSDDEGTYEDMWKKYPVMNRVIDMRSEIPWSFEGLKDQVDAILSELDLFEEETVKNPRYNNSHRIPVSEIREAQNSVRTLRSNLRAFLARAQEWDRKVDKEMIGIAASLEHTLEGTLYTVGELSDIADRYGLSNRDRSEYIFDRDKDYQTLHDLGIVGWRCKSVEEMKVKAKKANKELDKFVRDILEAHSDQTPASSYIYKIKYVRDEMARSIAEAEELTATLAAARKR